MKLQTRWTEKMAFVAEAGAHQVPMDTRPPLGDDSAMTPKQLLLAGVCGCTGMDVVALMKKYRQPLEGFEVSAEADLTEGGYPAIFKEILLTFDLVGALDPEKAVEAVHLSQTKFCGVSAMISKAVPISYVVRINGEQVGSGKAKFDI